MSVHIWFLHLSWHRSNHGRICVNRGRIQAER